MSAALNVGPVATTVLAAVGTVAPAAAPLQPVPVGAGAAPVLAGAESLGMGPLSAGSPLAILEGWLADVFGIGWIEDVVESLEIAIRTARGWPGLSIVFLYSFLIAFVLPGPSEVVLAAPLKLGIGFWPTLALIMLVSATGKAMGSVVAFHLGQEAKRAGPVIRLLERAPVDVMAWSRARTVELARTYGYAGLALALMVPFFPDTLSIYAFAVLERDYWRFAAATFLGSLGRLVITVGLFSGTLVVV